MKRLLTVCVILTLVALSVAGCAPPTVTPTPGPSTTGTGTPPATPAVEPSVTPTTTPAKESVPITVFFSYQEKMQAVQRWAPAGTTAVLREALTALLAGPTAAEKSAGLSSQIPAGTKLRGVSIDAGVAQVDLSREFNTGGGSLSMFHRIAQVVFTASQFDTVKSVRFYLEGKRLDVLGGEGVIIDKPQTRKMWEEQSPAILVTSPGWGGAVSEGTSIRGTANVFEAVFTLQIFDDAGLKLMEATVRASSGTGTRGTWSVKAKLGTTTATRGTIKVFDASAKDGKPQHVVVIPVTFER